MKKILIINLLLIMLLNSFCVCFASETQLIKHKGDCPLYLKYNGNFKLVHYAAYENGGKEIPAYCINPEFSGVGVDGRNEYAVKINGKITNEKIWKAIVNGYPYKSLEELGVECKEEAYTATQFAIYTVLHNRDVKDYTADETPAGRRTLAAYLKIMENVENFSEDKKIDAEVVPISIAWEIDENEIEYLSKCFSLKTNASTGGYTVKLKGENIEKLKITDENGNDKNTFLLNEKFKILAPIESLINDIKFEIELQAKMNTYPILYGETTIANTQNYALTGEKTEDFEINYQDIIPQNNSKIKIIKQDAETKKRLEGVKFNLLNSNKDFVIQDLITNENGEIILEHIMPGTYFLQETKTIEEYILNETPIEIKVNFNEEKEVIVENVLKEEQIKEEPINEVIAVPEQEVIVKTLPITGY